MTAASPPPLRLLLIDNDEPRRIALSQALSHAPDRIQVQQADELASVLALAQQPFDAVVLASAQEETILASIQSLRQAINAQGGQCALILLAPDTQDDALVLRAIEEGVHEVLQESEVSVHRMVRTVHLARQRLRMEQALQASEQKLQGMAERDVLTGVANRASFETALHQAVMQAQRQPSRIAVLLLNLDGFKSVNDALGRELGDQLLKTVAQRLAGSVRGSDLLARLGGDEFVVLARDMERDDQSRLLAQRLLEAMQVPVMLADTPLSITPSIGVAVYGQCATDPAELLKCAERAVERAKSSGRNQIHFFSDTLHSAVQQRNTLENELRHALRRGQFQLYYQAQVRADDETLAGVETLLRWHHPSRGVLPPKEFLPMAEELGLMGELSSWVLRTACRQLAIWREREDIDNIRIAVAVNLSALQLQNEALLGTVAQALTDSGLDSRSLELEITENVFIDQPHRAAQILHQLRERGITLSLDDFGTGYSSLQHLQLFPVGVLKIDKSFVDYIGRGDQHDRLMAAIIEFGKTLKLSIVAEGVETREQADFCRDQGVDLLQGYLFSQPLPAQQFEARFMQRLALRQQG